MLLSLLNRELAWRIAVYEDAQYQGLLAGQDVARIRA